MLADVCTDAKFCVSETAKPLKHRNGEATETASAIQTTRNSEAIETPQA